MTRKSEQEQGIAYPQLSKDQIDDVIDALMFATHNRATGPMTRRYDAAAGYLIGFYTRRWGLPAALRHRGQA